MKLFHSECDSAFCLGSLKHGSTSSSATIVLSESLETQISVSAPLRSSISVSSSGSSSDSSVHLDSLASASGVLPLFSLLSFLPFFASFKDSSANSCSNFLFLFQLVATGLFLCLLSPSFC